MKKVEVSKEHYIGDRICTVLSVLFVLFIALGVFSCVIAFTDWGQGVQQRMDQWEESSGINGTYAERQARYLEGAVEEFTEVRMGYFEGPSYYRYCEPDYVLRVCRSALQRERWDKYAEMAEENVEAYEELTLEIQSFVMGELKLTREEFEELGSKEYTDEEWDAFVLNIENRLEEQK